MKAWEASIYIYIRLAIHPVKFIKFDSRQIQHTDYQYTHPALYTKIITGGYNPEYVPYATQHTIQRTQAYNAVYWTVRPY